MASSTDLSQHDKQTLRVSSSVSPLLVSRRDAALMLGGISIASIKRLERSGELTAIRLNRRSPTSQVFYRRAQILALAHVEAGDAEGATSLI